MPHIDPRATNPSHPTPRGPSLTGFERGWVVLPKAPINGLGEPPVVIDVVLLHARRGIALLEVPPHWTPDAPQRLRRRLERAQFTAIYPGHLPIVHAQLLRGALSELPRVLTGAFAAEPPLDLPGGEAWMRAVNRALAPSPENEAGMPEVTSFLGPRHHGGLLRGVAGATLTIGAGLGLLLAFLPSDPPEDRVGQPSMLAEAAPARGLAAPALLRFASDVLKLPAEVKAGTAADALPDAAVPSMPDPRLAEVLRLAAGPALPSLPDGVLRAPDVLMVTDPNAPAAPPGPIARPPPPVAQPGPLPPAPTGRIQPGAGMTGVLPAVPSAPPAPAGLPLAPAGDPGGSDARPRSSERPAPPATIPGLAEPAQPPDLATARATPPARALPDPPPAAMPAPGLAAGEDEPRRSPALPTATAARPPDAAIPPPPASRQQPGPAPVVTLPARRVDPALIASLMRRGDALFALGDVSGARRFYERAAEAGSSAGARAAGRTYDPAVLAGLGVRGIRPEPEIAAAWYRLADSLAATEPR